MTFLIKLVFLCNIFIMNFYGKIPLDSIACSIIFEGGVHHVLYSDCWLSNCLGVEQTLEELIVRSLWIYHGKDHGLKISNDGTSNEYAEQYLDMLQQKKNITRDQIKEMCLKSGYSLSDIKKELNDQYMMQQAIEMTLAAHGYFSITSQEIETFYQNNPIVIGKKYVLCRGKSKKTIGDITNQRYEKKDIEWEEPYEVNKNDLSEKFSAIDEYTTGDIVYCTLDSKNQGVTYVYKLINVIPEKKVSLDESYEEIQSMLQSKKYNEGFKKITLELLNSDTILFSDITLKERCIKYVETKK